MLFALRWPRKQGPLAGSGDELGEKLAGKRALRDVTCTLGGDSDSSGPGSPRSKGEPPGEGAKPVSGHEREERDGAEREVSHGPLSGGACWVRARSREA